MHHYRFSQSKPAFNFLTYLVVAAICLVLAGCTVSIVPGNSSTTQCQSNCTFGSGVQGVQLFSDRNVIRAPEEAANRGLDVRVMLEPHPFGGGPSPSRTMDTLSAAGIKVKSTDPNFPLTHEKGMIIDGSTAFIMTSNFSRSALGGSSGSSSYTNREYGIIDTNSTDVQAVSAIFNADWKAGSGVASLRLLGRRAPASARPKLRGKDCPSFARCCTCSCAARRRASPPTPAPSQAMT
jgi:phosphatidylserine/phosphatidylglycerophosphate/cardiolipin synthase-like enzyme